MSVDFSRCPISRCTTWCSLLESSRSANVFRYGGEITTGHRPALRCSREVLAETRSRLETDQSRRLLSGYSLGGAVSAWGMPCATLVSTLLLRSTRGGKAGIVFLMSTG